VSTVFPAVPGTGFVDVISFTPVAAVLPYDLADELECWFTGNVSACAPSILSASDVYDFRILVTFTDTSTIFVGPDQAGYSMSAVPQSVADNSTAMHDPIFNQRFLINGLEINLGAARTIATVKGQVAVRGGATVGVTVTIDRAELVVVRRQVG
jgi:hypothetical protein